MAQVIVEVCGTLVGKDGKWGRCDRPVQHPTAKGGHKGCSTPDLRSYMAKAAQKTRQKQKKVEDVKKANDGLETVDLFWNANREKLERTNAPQLAALLEQEERVLDQTYWIRNGWKVQQEDPDYISLADGHEDLKAFVEERGVIESILTFSPELVEDEAHDKVAWDVKQYWKLPRLLTAICRKNEATKIYATYGIMTTITTDHLRAYQRRASKTPFWDRGLDCELDENLWLSGKEAETQPTPRTSVTELRFAGPPPEAVAPVADNPLELTKWVVPGPNPGLNLNQTYIPPDEKSRW